MKPIDLERFWRNAHDLQVVIDAAGVFLSVNPAAIRAVLHHQGNRTWHRAGPKSGHRLRQAVRRGRNGESTPGEGTTFTIYLPRVEQDGTPKPEGRVEVRGDGTGICVLLVEDNADVGEFAISALNELGFDSVLARDGAEALAALKKDCARFHILFTDVVMPGISGVELAQRVREKHPHLPIILTSGYSHVLVENASHGFELLHKPYLVDQLARVLHKAIAWHGQVEPVTG